MVVAGSDRDRPRSTDVVIDLYLEGSLSNPFPSGLTDSIHRRESFAYYAAWLAESTTCAVDIKRPGGRSIPIICRPCTPASRQVTAMDAIASLRSQLTAESVRNVDHVRLVCTHGCTHLHVCHAPLLLDAYLACYPSDA